MPGFKSRLLRHTESLVNQGILPIIRGNASQELGIILLDIYHIMGQFVLERLFRRGLARFIDCAPFDGRVFFAQIKYSSIQICECAAIKRSGACATATEANRWLGALHRFCQKYKGALESCQ